MLPRVPRKFTVKDILDTQPKFREWIEQTQLFNVLIEETNQDTRFFKTPGMLGILPQLVSLEISMQLKDVQVKTAYDLPLELIVQFYENSPFFSSSNVAPIQDYQPIKLIENGRENV